MLKKVDRKNRFVSMFDPKTGFYVRSGVYDENGKDTGIDPFMTQFPELIEDIVALCKEYCGAVAISWYRQPHTIRAIQMLLDAGIKTNIHYVLGNNSIDEAIDRLRSNDFPQGINAVIFLLHKPVGLGSEDNVLSANDPRVKEFFDIVDHMDAPFKVDKIKTGCSAPR